MLRNFFLPYQYRWGVLPTPLERPINSSRTLFRREHTPLLLELARVCGPLHSRDLGHIPGARIRSVVIPDQGFLISGSGIFPMIVLRPLYLCLFRTFSSRRLPTEFDLDKTPGQGPAYIRASERVFAPGRLPARASKQNVRFGIGARFACT